MILGLREKPTDRGSLLPDVVPARESLMPSLLAKAASSPRAVPAFLHDIQENTHFIPGVADVPYRRHEWPDAYLQILIESGILNPDYTPNRAVAAVRGWPLREPTDEDFEYLEALQVKAR